MAIYFTQTQSQIQNFSFAPDFLDEVYFTKILNVVFYPGGITAEDVKEFVQANNTIGSFYIQIAALSIYVYYVVKALTVNLAQRHINAC